MTILSNDNGKITKISLNNEVNIITDHEEKRICYSIELPKVTTTSKEDAETIQSQVNTFVTQLCQKLMK
jgi:phosphoenolpyruvate synthase/pyruvate phosphate dikinase